MKTNAPRNQFGRIEIDKTKTNEAFIGLRVLDERYLMQDFTYVVDVNFKSLKNAIDSQDYIFSIINTINGNIFGETTLEGDVDIFSPLSNFDQVPTIETFLSNIANLINKNADNPAAQRFLISRLESRLESLQEQNSAKDQEINIEIENTITSKLIIEQRDKEIEELKKTIELLTLQLQNTNNE